MEKTIAYSSLKKDKRAYGILLLRDQHDADFSIIADTFGLSRSRVSQIYSEIKQKQIRLYMRRIVEVQYENFWGMETIYRDAFRFYRDYAHVCAYLEKKYPYILAQYRAGEPGMPEQFLQKLPPFQHQLSEETIARVVKLCDVEKATFQDIAQECALTEVKARSVYQDYYKTLALELVHALEEQAKSKKEKEEIRHFYQVRRYRYKKCYEDLLKTYAEELRELNLYPPATPALII